VRALDEYGLPRYLIKIFLLGMTWGSHWHMRHRRRRRRQGTGRRRTRR
jgi:hypothetical protein